MPLSAAGATHHHHLWVTDANVTSTGWQGWMQLIKADSVHNVSTHRILTHSDTLRNLNTVNELIDMIMIVQLDNTTIREHISQHSVLYHSWDALYTMPETVTEVVNIPSCCLESSNVRSYRANFITLSVMLNFDNNAAITSRVVVKLYNTTTILISQSTDVNSQSADDWEL